MYFYTATVIDNYTVIIEASSVYAFWR